jgi:hypothetical protein
MRGGDDCGATAGMNQWQGKPRSLEEIHRRAALSTTHSTWPDPGSNSGRRCGMPATNRRNYDAAMIRITTLLIIQFCATSCHFFLLSPISWAVQSHAVEPHLHLERDASHPHSQLQLLASVYICTERMKGRMLFKWPAGSRRRIWRAPHFGYSARVPLQRLMYAELTLCAEYNFACSREQWHAPITVTVSFIAPSCK